jgi:hypothetical protein
MSIISELRENGASMVFIVKSTNAELLPVYQRFVEELGMHSVGW